MSTATALLIVASVLAANPENPSPTSAVLAEYQAARAGVGRDAQAHVRLALWCEAHGLGAERLKHLAMAVMIDPANATARGLLGLVAFRGRWQRPDAVGETVKADTQMNAALADYFGRRAAMANTADAHWRLALWCEEHGLTAESKAHLATVVRLDPGREAAWKRLGCKKQGGRWVSEAQLAAEKEEAEAQKKADREWRPRLARWRSALSNKAKRAEAEEGLAGVTDPRAVPSVLAVFLTDDPRSQAITTRILGQIDSPGSSRALAALSILGGSTEVRRVATETLKRRDPREFAGLLVTLLRDPIKYEVRPVGGPGSPGALFVQGKQFNVQRLYAPPPLPNIPLFEGEAIAYDAAGYAVISRAVGINEVVTHTTSLAPAMKLGQFANVHPTDPAVAAAVNQFRRDPSPTMARFWPSHPETNLLRHSSPSAFDYVFSLSVDRATRETSINQVQIPIGRIVAEHEKTAMVAQEQLARDVAEVDSYNKAVGAMNERIAQVLKDVSGEDRGEAREAWSEWWTNINGYAYITPEERPVPTYVENVPLAYTPRQVPVTGSTRMVQTKTEVEVTPHSIVSCFGAGTAVRTLRGTAPIETLRVGDQVLTMDLKSGALGFQPIVVVHHNPPSKTFLIRLAGETIVSSPFHRFWKVGHGWVMAQDLGTGDTLRLLDGPAAVESVEPGPIQPVYNLDVAVHHDFFAGVRGALVHDNTVAELRLAPFDAAPSLVPASSTAR